MILRRIQLVLEKMTAILQSFIIDIESISGYIIGALIAGIIGVATAFYDRKLSRKQKHLEDLQRQLDIISLVVNDPVGLYWPTWSPDTERCPVRGSTPNTYPLQKYTIGTHQVTYTVGKETIAEIPNNTLYEDFKKHFPELSKCLDEWQQKVRRDGPMILKAYYDICDALYADTHDLNISIREKSGLAYPIEEGYPFDAAALNILLKIDEKYWPNLRNSVGQMIGDVKMIAKKYVNRTEVSTITKLSDEFNQLKIKCDKAIEEVGVTTHLKGKCKFL